MLGEGEGKPPVPNARHRAGGAFHLQLPRRAQIEQPSRQHALVDVVPFFRQEPFGIEGPRAQPARTERIVDNRDMRRENRLAELIFQKARAARDAGTRNRARQLADKAAGDALLEHDGYFARRHLARTEPPHGALARMLADARGVGNIGGDDAGSIIVVAFHCRAFARN